MNFRTEITLKKSNFNISYQEQILTIGSCFTENIGKIFEKYKFKVKTNPFGILYNPISIEKGLKLLLENKKLTEEDLIYHNEEWHSFYHHGSFSNQDKTLCLENINKNIEFYHNYLKRTDYLLITFGSSYVYRNKSNKMVVANCHKIPEKEFEQELFDLNETTKLWENLILELQSFNPKIKLIFTVSPIRYLKYGFEQNSISKAQLFILINQIKKANFSQYFPSYELVMDDLREYRFYEQDMIHPNNIAIEYIWEKFVSYYFSSETINIMKKVEKLIQAQNHRPKNINSEAHQAFIKRTEELEKEINLILQKQVNV